MHSYLKGDFWYEEHREAEGEDGGHQKIEGPGAHGIVDHTAGQVAQDACHRGDRGEKGLGAGFDLLYTKSVLDFVSGIMMTAAMGVGVFGSALFTLVFQGAVVLLAGVIAPFMSDALILELSCTGSLMILATGLNMIEVTTFKILNLVPALLVVPLAMWALGAAGLLA